MKDLLGVRFLTSGDLREIAGITYRQVNDWEKRGILSTMPCGGGSNDWRRFTLAEALYLAFLQLAAKQGYPVTAIHRGITKHSTPGKIGRYLFRSLTRGSGEVSMVIPIRTGELFGKVERLMCKKMGD